MADRTKFQRGFTFVEMIMALSVVVLISGVVFYSFSSFRDRQLVRITALGVKEFLVETRSLTMASRDGFGYGVHIESGRLIRFTGSSYSAGDPNNEEYLIDIRTTISNINLTGGVSNVFWNKVKGDVSASGSLTISFTGDDPMSETILINQTGLAVLE